MEHIIEHVGVACTDYARSTAWYKAALAPLGIELKVEYGPAGGYGRGSRTDFWVVALKPDAPSQQVTPIHVALAARSRADVDAFHAAAVAAGGKDNGGPGVREHYHPNYYAAFVYDLDGNNIEAVFHG